MTVPIYNSYRVTENLIAGEYPRNSTEASSQDKIRDLLNYGITAFIDLTVENELEPYSQWIEQATYQRFPIVDVSIPATQKLTTRILDAIDENMRQGHTVYVHCWGGVGRTGLIIGCWLARHYDLSGEERLARLMELWKQCPKSQRKPYSPETAEQRQYVMDWKAGA